MENKLGSASEANSRQTDSKIEGLERRLATIESWRSVVYGGVSVIGALAALVIFVPMFNPVTIIQNGIDSRYEAGLLRLQERLTQNDQRIETLFTELSRATHTEATVIGLCNGYGEPNGSRASWGGVFCTAFCPINSIVLSGGCEVTNSEGDSVILHSSVPSGPLPGNLQGWRCGFYNSSGNLPVRFTNSFRATARCRQT